MIGIIIATLIGLTISTAQVCPPPEVLHPCTCREFGTRQIICDFIQDDFNLKGVFDNASAYISDDVIFNYLYIGNTALSTIEEGAIQHLKFFEVVIVNNPKLKYISPRAVNASRDITTSISLWINPIENKVPYERDVFDFVKSFKGLETFYMVSNISTIPDDAFQNMTFLHDIRITDNNISISSIGSRVFSNTPGLKSLYLSKNSIPNEGVSETAFDDINGLVEVYLDCNKIDYLEQKRFQTLLDKADVVVVGDAENRCPDSEYARLHCDERADWICDNEERYRGKLRGFLCKEGKDYKDIWEYCKERNTTFRA